MVHRKKRHAKHAKKSTKENRSALRAIKKLHTKLKKALKHGYKAGKKPAKRRAHRRDPSWYGHPRLHAKAAKLGHKRQGHKLHKKSRRDPAGYTLLGMSGGHGHHASRSSHGGTPWYLRPGKGHGR